MHLSERRVLDPVERVSEVLFGLIMVLTFTGSLSVATAGREEVREMLIGAVGCNLAWGIVDAVMYILAALVARQRGLRILDVARAGDVDRARGEIAADLPPAIASLIDAWDAERLRHALTTLPQDAHAARLTRDDIRGAVETFFLVFLCTFPVVVPFLFFSSGWLALRVSNAIAVAMLFLGGYVLGRYSGLRPWALGLSMTITGIVLVVITIALGG